MLFTDEKTFAVNPCEHGKQSSVCFHRAQ